jgi:hypothetical protein
MADVRDRAQLFLVGALSLAVVFVVLALVVNSAIYTENLATRSTDSGTDDAVKFRATVESSVGGLVAYENRNTVDTTALQTGIDDDIDDRLARFNGRHGAFSRVTYLSDSPGTQLIQDTDREFSNNGGGSDDWELATGVTATRSFQQRSEIDALEDTSFFGGLFGTDVFRTNVTDDDGDVYSVALYHDAGADEAYVTVRDPSGTDRTCTYDYDSASETVTVDLTSAQFAGHHCGALEFWGDLDTPYSIEYVNGQSAEGTWDLVVQGSETSANYGAAADGPYTKSAIYDVTVRLLYRTDDVTYKTSVTVAPGEPDG